MNVLFMYWKASIAVKKRMCTGILRNHSIEGFKYKLIVANTEPKCDASPFIQIKDGVQI